MNEFIIGRFKVDFFYLFLVMIVFFYAMFFLIDEINKKDISYNLSYENNTNIEEIFTLNWSAIEEYDQNFTRIPFEFEIYEGEELFAHGQIDDFGFIELPNEVTSYEILTMTKDYYNTHGTLLIANKFNLSLVTSYIKVTNLNRKGNLNISHEGNLKGENINLTVNTNGLFQNAFACYKKTKDLNINHGYVETSKKPKSLDGLNITCFIIYDTMLNNQIKLNFNVLSENLTKESYIGFYFFDHEWVKMENGDWDYNYEVNRDNLTEDIGSGVYYYRI